MLDVYVRLTRHYLQQLTLLIWDGVVEYYYNAYLRYDFVSTKYQASIQFNNKLTSLEMDSSEPCSCGNTYAIMAPCS